jgi:hypothetical protein
VLPDVQSDSGNSPTERPEVQNRPRSSRKGSERASAGSPGRRRSHKGKTEAVLWDVDEDSGIALDVWHYSRLLAYAALGFMAMSGSYIVFDWLQLLRK